MIAGFNLKCVCFSFILIVPFLNLPVAIAAGIKDEYVVSAGWKKIYETKGDLNKDNIPDRLIVVEETNPKNFVKNKYLGTEILNLNPRKLLIQLSETDHSQKIYEVSDLIASAGNLDTPCLMDSFSDDSIRVSDGSLIVKFYDELSCGSWTSGINEFRYKYENGRFKLIGKKITTFSRNTGELDIASYDYITLRVKRIKKDSDNHIISRASHKIKYDNIFDLHAKLLSKN